MIRQRPIRGESLLDFLGESEGCLPPPHDSFPDAGEAINDFWSMSGSFIYRHHLEPRVKLYSPREESFPIPLKYIDVSKTTHTNLDVKQEKRIDDYWNIDGSRDLSDPWTGFTQFTLLEEKAPDGYMWSGVRLTRKQLTSRPDHLWPELWKSNREKGLFLSVYVDDIKLAGKKQNLDPMWKVLNEEVDLGEPTSFLDHVYLGCTQRQCEISKDTVDNYRTMFESRIFGGRSREITIPSKTSYFIMVL